MPQFSDDDIINMSDDDFGNLPLPEDDNLQQTFEDEATDAGAEEKAELAQADDDDLRDREDGGELNNELDKVDNSGDSDDDSDTELDDTNPDGSDSDDATDDDEPASLDEDGNPIEKDASTDAEDDKDVKTDDDKSDPWAELTKPFKANNVEMSVDNVTDARRLMQMGANYHQKMTDIKDDRKFIETLRDNDLLDSDKINLLIDASKGNQSAITKLLKDSGINPMDVDVDKADEYEATSYQTTDAQLELRDVLSGIRGTDTYTQTMSIVSQKWDAKSQDLIMGKPDVLNTINDHVASGVYDTISTAIARQRILGNPKLDGLSDIEAYLQVGNELQDAGAFKATPEKEAEPAKEIVKPKPKPKKQVSPTADAKRRQAAAPRQAPPAKADLSDLDDMSDEEFAKHFAKLKH